MINMQYFMAGTWERIANRTCISQRFSHMLEKWTRFFGTYPTGHGTSIGPIWGMYTSTKHVLCHLEGRPFPSSDSSSRTIHQLYQEFDFVIKSYCRKDRLGDGHVMRNNYEVIREEDSQIVCPSELGSIIQPGTILEISIFLRKDIPVQEDKTKCLRYGHINIGAQDWINWKVYLNLCTHW